MALWARAKEAGVDAGAVLAALGAKERLPLTIGLLAMAGLAGVQGGVVAGGLALLVLGGAVLVGAQVGAAAAAPAALDAASLRPKAAAELFRALYELRNNVQATIPTDDGATVTPDATAEAVEHIEATRELLRRHRDTLGGGLVTIFETRFKLLSVAALSQDPDQAAAKLEEFDRTRLSLDEFLGHLEG